MHAYVSCSGMVDGHLAHSGMHGECPHEIKVCIVKKDNPPAVFRELLGIAGPKPEQWISRKRLRAGGRQKGKSEPDER